MPWTDATVESAGWLEDAVWVLADPCGFWNDDNIWVDGAVWRDTCDDAWTDFPTVIAS